MGYYVIDPETNEEIHVSKWKIKYPDQDASCEELTLHQIDKIISHITSILIVLL